MELVPEGYKQTEVGVIPEDWEVKRLPEICLISSGKAHEKHIVDIDGYVCVNSKFISTNGRVVKYSSLRDGIAEIGDILMVMSDLPNGKALAKTFLVDKADTYAVNQRICNISPIKDNSQYLNYTLNRNAYFLKFDDGVGQTNLGSIEFRKCEVALPSLPEQRAIATALSDVDALLSSLDRLIAKKEALKQGAMQVLLSGEKRLEGFSGDWEVRKLGEVLKVCHGRSQHEIVAENGRYPILATGGEIGRTNHSLHLGPSVLIGRKGTIDKPVFIDSPFWSVDTLFYTEISSQFDPKFIYYKFCMIRWYDYNEASGVPSLSAKTIEKIEIKHPSLPEQTAIATILSDMDAELDALRARRAKVAVIKKGMMGELLTGRVRLV